MILKSTAWVGIEACSIHYLPGLQPLHLANKCTLLCPSSTSAWWTYYYLFLKKNSFSIFNKLEVIFPFAWPYSVNIHWEMLENELSWHYKMGGQLGKPSCSAGKQRGRESNHFLSVLFSVVWGGGRGIFQKLFLVAASQPCQCHWSNFAEMS